MILPQFRRAVLVFTYEDYRLYLGGASKAVLAQEQCMLEYKISVLTLFPFNLARGKIGKKKWLMRIDGEVAAVANTDEIILLLGRIVQSGYEIGGVQIHHFKNLDLNSLSHIIDSIEAKIFFYLHDYYTLCPNGNGNLLKKDDELCDYETYDLDRCKGCNLYSNQINEIRAFFNRYQERMTFIAPSDACKRIWCSGFKEYQNKVIVIYHQTEVGSYKRNNNEIKDEIRVGFVGTQAVNKGWPDYKKLIKSLGDKSKHYKFYYFGNAKEIINDVTNVPVDFHSGLNSMTEAIRNNDIDIVLLLSNRPETYSYTYYESKCADAFIIAYDCSGNIADQICKTSNGLVLRNVDDLISYLYDIDRVRDDLNLYKRSEHLSPFDLIENSEFIELLDFKGQSYNSIKTKAILKNSFPNSVLVKLYLIQSKLRNHTTK